jgi:hypothetical protein
VGSRFLLSGFARRFRTDVQTLLCRRFRGGPSLSDRALALDRIAGSLFLACMGALAIWLASQTLPANPLQIPLIGESAQAASGTTEVELSRSGAEAANHMSSAEIRALQGRLKALGFDPGAIDGVAGPRTLQALNEYRASMDLGGATRVDRTSVAELLD